MPYMDKSKTNSWSTPKKLREELQREFDFNDFDPCPLNDNPEFDGKNIDWVGDRIFVNPPYSDLKSTKKRI